MDEDLIELGAPGGVDEANHGTARYRVDNSGRVLVPREAAFWLIKHAGFRPVPTAAPAPAAPAFAGAGLPSAKEWGRYARAPERAAAPTLKE